MVIRKREDDERIGCDLCKKTGPTERFEGLRGNILWFCDGCMKSLINGSDRIKKYVLLGLGEQHE